MERGELLVLSQTQRFVGRNRARAALLVLVALATTGSSHLIAHDGGTAQFPCLEGPFGVPGLQSPSEQIGEWGPLIPWPEQATHSVMLHTGKLLWWRGEAPKGVPSTTYLWDPETNNVEERQTGRE